MKLEQIIRESNALIERLIDLSLCRDCLLDERREYFYSIVRYEDLVLINHLLDEQDLYQETCLYVTEQFRKWKGSGVALIDYLKIALPRFFRDLLNRVISEYKNSRDYNIQYSSHQTSEITLNLYWLIAESNVLLSNYEKYIFYLYAYKCFTIDQITAIVYQDRKSIRNTINDIQRSLNVC